MIQTVEIFYSFQCPYSYLAIDRLCQIEQRFDVRCLWQPFSAKAAGQNYQSAPMSIERTSYVKEDTARLAKKADVPLQFAAEWPEKEFDPDRSVRGAIVAADLERIMEYNIKMFQRWWGDNEDPNDQTFLIQLCDELDVDPNEFAGRMSTADTRERVRGLWKRGKKLGVFGTPTVVINDERFYGIDRIGAAEERLAEMGLKRPSWA